MNNEVGQEVRMSLGQLHKIECIRCGFGGEGGLAMRSDETGLKGAVMRFVMHEISSAVGDTYCDMCQRQG